MLHIPPLFLSQLFKEFSDRSLLFFFFFSGFIVLNQCTQLQGQIVLISPKVPDLKKKNNFSSSKLLKEMRDKILKFA